MELLQEETQKEPETAEPTNGCKRRTSLLLKWLKDPRNQFMFLGDNASSPVFDNIKRKEDGSIRETSSPVSEPELLFDSTIHDSSDSDIWDVSSIETPTLVRKTATKKARRKTTSFKTCKHTCDGETKLKRRHTCGSTRRDLLSAMVPSEERVCHCGKGGISDGQPIREFCFDFRALKRNSFNDADSGITEPSENQKGSLSPAADIETSNAQVPLDETARRSKKCGLFRSKSESNISIQSTFSNIYRDINAQIDTVSSSELSQIKTRLPSRKPQSLYLPREKGKSSKDVKDQTGLHKTISLFDLSGTDPSSEADFFFGIKEEETGKEFATPLCGNNISKSCGDIVSAQKDHMSTPLSRRVVIIPQNIDRKSKENRQRVRSVPSLRVRALRRQHTNEGSVTGSKLSRVKLGSLRLKDSLNKDSEKDKLDEMRERLKSVDINDLVNEADMSQVDDMGNTLLHYAAAQGNDKLIKTILGGGASVWTPNKFGHLPLDLVSSFRSATFLSTSTLFYGHGSNMVRQGHLHPKCIHYEL